MTLILNFHPNPNSSIRGNMLLKNLKQDNSVTIHNVVEHFSMNPTEEQVKNEQKIIEKYKKIVFLYPLYWYNMPAIGVEYLNTVFAMGWAMHMDGKDSALKGKYFQQIVTTGAYKSMFENIKEVDCINQKIALWTGMQWRDTFVFFGDDGEDQAKQVSKILQ